MDPRNWVLVRDRERSWNVDFHKTEDAPPPSSSKRNTRRERSRNFGKRSHRVVHPEVIRNDVVRDNYVNRVMLNVNIEKSETIVLLSPACSSIVIKLNN